MLARKMIAAIHAAKNNAHLNDNEYRLILIRNAGVKSSKDLQTGDFGKVMKAINQSAQRLGWQWPQIMKFRQYCRYCSLTETQRNMLIYKVVNEVNDESEHLDNIAFDIVMAQLEELLEQLIRSGSVQQPGNIKLHYWRDKCPKHAKANSRQLHKIRTLFEQLKEYLEPEKRNERYLFGLARRVCREEFNLLKDIDVFDAIKLTEALKDKLQYEQDRNPVPF